LKYFIWYIAFALLIPQIAYESTGENNYILGYRDSDPSYSVRPVIRDSALYAPPVVVEAPAKSLEEQIGDPHLVKIARCESGLRQFDDNGKVLKSYLGSNDWGVLQINKTYHLKKAQELGFDIDTTEGNIAYGKWLYQREGTRPWNASKNCWSK